MKDRRYYTVSFDERNYPEILKLRLKCGGIVAYGRWEALKQILYDADGGINISDELIRMLLKRELEFDSDDELDGFLKACLDLELLFVEFPDNAQAIIQSKEVLEGISFKRRKAESGRKGGKAKATRDKS